MNNQLLTVEEAKALTKKAWSNRIDEAIYSINNSIKKRASEGELTLNDVNITGFIQEQQKEILKAFTSNGFAVMPDKNGLYTISWAIPESDED